MKKNTDTSEKYDIQFHEFFCALGIFARKCGCNLRITIFLDRLRMCTVFCFARVARVYTCEYIEIFPGAKLVILVRANIVFQNPTTRL